MSKEEMIPKIRIKKFTNELDSKDLKEIADINPKTSLPEEFIYIDLESVEGTQIVSERIEKNSDAPSRAQRLAETGDIFYQTVRPYQKNNVLFNYNSNNYVFSTGYAQIRCFEEINNNFLFTYMQSQKFVNTVLRKCTGTSYPAINSSDLSTIKINFPCFSEQQKIGDLFEKLDQAISLQQQVLEATKEYKQSMQQKMVPKKDKKVPEIRFKEFRRKWEPISLKDSIDIQGGFAFKSSQFGSGKMPIIRISNIMNNGKIVGPFKYYKEKDNFEKYKVSGGEYLIAMSGATTGKVGINKDIAYVNQRVGIIKTKLNVDNFFIGIILNMAKFQYYLTTQWGAGAQPNVSNKQIMNYNTLIPSFEEQQKIGSFFKTLDKKIEQEEKKLETYQSMKKALMQRMFV